MPSEGKLFEKAWENSYKDTPYAYIRLIDSAKWIKGQGSSFTPSNICDAIQFYPPYMWLLELKSTEGTGISFTPVGKEKNEKTSVMIKENQIKKLLQYSHKDGIISGFIMNFRERNLKTKSEPNEVFFIHINDFIEFSTNSGKSTISREDCRNIGVTINGHCKKIHYTYDITKFTNDIIAFCKNKKYIKSY